MTFIDKYTMKTSGKVLKNLNRSHCYFRKGFEMFVLTIKSGAI